MFRYIPFCLFVLILGCQYTSTYDYFLRLESGDLVESDEDKMFIRFNEDVYLSGGRQVVPYEISTEREFGLRDCGINRDETSVEDQYCILDINEMDLLGINSDNPASQNIPFILEYQIPRETCEYASFYAPWHFNQLSGYGPRELWQCTELEDQTNVVNSEGDSTSTNNNKVYYAEPCTTGNCRGTGTISTKCGVRAYWKREDSEEDNWVSKQFCSSAASNPTNPYDIGNLYDRSGGTRGYLSNCCFGAYALVAYAEEESEAAAGLPPIVTVTTSTEEWGGNLSECIGGPARLNWDTTIESPELGSYPVPQIFNTWEQGLRGRFEIEKPAMLNAVPRTTEDMTIHLQYASVGIANYYDGIEDLQWSSNGRCANCPDIFKSDDSHGDRPVLIGYPYFTLECLDSNMEAIHRVHLSVREWNTLEEFHDFQDSAGDNGDPDVTGEEGVDCNYYDADEFENRCNDLLDLNDFLLRGDGYPKVNYNN